MKRFRRKWLNKQGKQGQAMAELTIAGAILIMLLGYLLQQGYIYNMRQALEMYTFRKALEISRNQQREITLTAMRDILIPSFFSGLSRQRIMATASVEYNPYLIYNPTQDSPQDIGSRRLIQVNDWMIQNNYFIEVPPTLLTIDRPGEDRVTRWEPSAITELDSQKKKINKVTTYEYVTRGSEDEREKMLEKQLEATEDVHTVVTFDDAAKIVEDWKKNEPDATVTVDASTVPKNMDLILRERITKFKRVVTPNK